MDFPKHFSVRIYAFVLSLVFVFSIFIAVPVQAASLHTFKQYGAMTEQQRSEIWSNTTGLIYKDALTRRDEKQAACLRRTFLTKYGKKYDVQMAHATLRGKIQAEIEIERDAVKRDPRKRVEYLIGNHLFEVCPSSPKNKVGFYFYGPPLKKVVNQSY